MILHVYTACHYQKRPMSEGRMACESSHVSTLGSFNNVNNKIIIIKKHYIFFNTLHWFMNQHVFHAQITNTLIFTVVKCECMRLVGRVPDVLIYALLFHVFSGSSLYTVEILCSKYKVIQHVVQVCLRV